MTTKRGDGGTFGVRAAVSAPPPPVLHRGETIGVVRCQYTGAMNKFPPPSWSVSSPPEDAVEPDEFNLDIDLDAFDPAQGTAAAPWQPDEDDKYMIAVLNPGYVWRDVVIEPSPDDDPKLLALLAAVEARRATEPPRPASAPLSPEVTRFAGLDLAAVQQRLDRPLALWYTLRALDPPGRGIVDWDMVERAAALLTWQKSKLYAMVRAGDGLFWRHDRQRRRCSSCGPPWSRSGLGFWSRGTPRWSLSARWRISSGTCTSSAPASCPRGTPA